MNLTPPRIEEGYEAKPTPREDTFGATIEKMSSDAFANAWRKATEAGRINVSADDPRIVTAFKQTNKYLADMASAGMSLAEGVGGAVAGAIGEIFGGTPEGEVRLARDIYSMTEAFAGSGIARGANLMDDLVESGAATASKVAARANQPGPMPEVLGSNLGNLAAPKAPYKPSMFRRVDEAIPVSGNFEIATFYSPTVETLRNTDFPSKGMTGGDLLKLLQDKTPGIRKAELDSLGLNIDKSKRYSKEDILGLAEKRSYRVTAETAPANLYMSTQRQKLQDRDVGYDEIKVNAIPNDPESPAFFPSKGSTHYDLDTIAHTRMSIRESAKDGTEYALVEEIQSDLLQHKPLKPRGPISLEEAREEALNAVAADIIGGKVEDQRVYEAAQDWFDRRFIIASEQQRLVDSGTPEDKENLLKLIEESDKLPDVLELAKELGTSQRVVERLGNAFENAGYQQGASLERRMKAVGPSPITDDSDAVRMALQAALAKADDAEVSSLVIPNIQRIVAERARPGTEEFENFVSPKSGFTRTYVNGVEKFIKQLQSEFGDAIKVEQIELPYQTRSELPKSAIKIDFSELRRRGNVDLRVGRFAEGGMVEMQKLFEEGGMTDDGMTREPVTGNEIPPGSLAEEVRDDIPARLSSGEYVVPADVVRFFGVKFFEDLRMKAKEGLSEMDKDGRIGGEPAVEDEELTPEEEQMLREALGAPMQMAEGGVVPAFDRTQFNIGNTSGFQTRKYINPKTKEERNVAFINGMPLGAIPEGFVPYTEEAAKVEEVKPSEGAPAVTPVQEGVGGEGRDMADANKGDGQSGYAGWAEQNKDAIMADPLGFGMNALSGVGEQGKGVGGVLGGLLGAVAPGLGALTGGLGAISAADKISDARVALGIMESQGKKGTPEYTALESAINSTISKMPALSNLTQSGIIGSGKSKSKALQDALTGGEGVDYTSSGGVGYKGFGGTVDTGFSRSVATGPTAPSTSGRPGRNPAYGGTPSAAPSAAPSGGAPSAGSSAGPSRGGDDRSASGFGIDARAKGGLMMKPKKSKAKAKGLAGKQ